MADAGVYPRVCGGTGVGITQNPPGAGLSPRVRGNLFIGGGRSAQHGSIPACAGEPDEAELDEKSPGVYPRVCGGTRSTKPWARWRPGLSPRVRGNRWSFWMYTGDLRSIPACAGEPSDTHHGTNGHPVYPRVCGGTAHRPECAGPWHGLSPRVRGNRDTSSFTPYSSGSIPACAGEPYTSSRSGSYDRVYPRVCGGTSLRPEQILVVRGLSPRVRGNPVSSRGAPWRLGSIPACAGEPSSPYRLAMLAWVYPRVCGGTSFEVSVSTNMNGLSPRVRGNHEAMA